jgi:hypothetical protein
MNSPLRKFSKPTAFKSRSFGKMQKGFNEDMYTQLQSAYLYTCDVISRINSVDTSCPNAGHYVAAQFLPAPASKVRNCCYCDRLPESVHTFLICLCLKCLYSLSVEKSLIPHKCKDRSSLATALQCSNN